MNLKLAHLEATLCQHSHRLEIHAPCSEISRVSYLAVHYSREQYFCTFALQLQLLSTTTSADVNAHAYLVQQRLFE